MPTPEAVSSLHVARTFRVSDIDCIVALLEAYPLVTLVSARPDASPRASSVPLLVRREEGGTRFFVHLDRRNPQVASLQEGLPLLLIAHGPSAYVSPAWFPRRPAAPTYLHVTAHMHAIAQPIHDPDDVASLLLDTVDAFERGRAGQWQFDGGERFLAGMVKGVEAFELRVNRLEAACKLSQDRSISERIAIARALESSSSSGDRAIAKLIRDDIASVTPHVLPGQGR